MNLLFLRGQLPVDRPVAQITFSSLAENDDMWTHYAHEIVRLTGGRGELWYEKGKREVAYTPTFTERWVKRYASTTCAFQPDLVFARGGFDFMAVEARRHPNACKVYYGAGARAVPKAGGPWDLVLVDTPAQLAVARKRKYRAELFIKPAAENVFFPVTKAPQYDIIYVANYSKTANKGHSFILPALADHKFLHVGISRKKWRLAYPNGTFAGWVPRRQMAEHYASAKLAVVWTRGQDSCPRVVPEALACDCPVLIGCTTKLNFDLYVTPQSGRVFDKSSFAHTLRDMLNEHATFTPRQHYDSRLSLQRSAQELLDKCREI